MRSGSRARLSIRTALLAIIAASVIPCAVLLHLTWWRTATRVSHDLVDTLALQITDAVRRAWWGRVAEVQGLARPLREALAATRGAADHERILVATARATPALSWLLSLTRSGEIVAVEDARPDRIRVFHAGREGEVAKAVEDRSGSDAGPFDAPRKVTRLIADGELWLEEARGWDEPNWAEVRATPDGQDRAVAYVDARGDPVLAAMIGFSRFAALLAEIPVGRTGRSYVLGPDGAIVIAAAASMVPRVAALDRAALAAGRIVAARPERDRNVNERVRLELEGAGYAIGLSPLWFQGWQLAVVVPEAEFLSEIDSTLWRAALWLTMFIAITGLVSVVAVRIFVAKPIETIVGDLALVERFDLESVPFRNSRLIEVDRLSQAINRMSASLADFGKFIPTDLVRTLVADGVRAEPGGNPREITVLFADLAGFTALSERLGDEVVPVVSRFLEIASLAIAAEGGTVDKFIGDAIMAFWGAPHADPDHAFNACRAALKIAEAMTSFPFPGNDAARLKVRIGIQTGTAIVGNIGSRTRLNYTALGDTVNLASRFEGVNKIYGTTILVGEATRKVAGDRLSLREVDTVAVYGRVEGVRVYELLGERGEDRRAAIWTQDYAAALDNYRAGRFGAALVAIEAVLLDRPCDGPARRLAEICRRAIADPPPRDWRPVTTLDMK